MTQPAPNVTVEKGGRKREIRRHDGPTCCFGSHFLHLLTTFYQHFALAVHQGREMSRRRFLLVSVAIFQPEWKNVIMPKFGSDRPLYLCLLEHRAGWTARGFSRTTFCCCCCCCSHFFPSARSNVLNQPKGFCFLFCQQLMRNSPGVKGILNGSCNISGGSFIAMANSSGPLLRDSDQFR